MTVNRSDFFKETWLSGQDIQLKKKQLFLFPTKFIGISRQIKQGEHRQ